MIRVDFYRGGVPLGTKQLHAVPRVGEEVTIIHGGAINKGAVLAVRWDISERETIVYVNLEPLD